MIVTLDNISFNKEEVLDYYKTLNEKFMHLHWYYAKDHNDPECIDSLNRLDKMHGWGLQTVLEDTNLPYHNDVDPHDEDYTHFKNTPLVFGFAERLLKFFKNPYRTFLTVYPSDQGLAPHSTSGPRHFKILVPIVSNSHANLLIVDNGEEKRIPIKEGSVYLNHTSSYTGLSNDGDTDLVFIQLNSPYENLDYTLNLKGTI